MNISHGMEKAAFLGKWILSAGIILLCLSAFPTTTPAQARYQTRCGWFSNPTPANAWLIDKDGEWIIGIQGGYQADGDWPRFSEKQWIETNVHYGYGCACIRATFNRRSGRVLQIRSGYARPISACRKDPALRRQEPK